MLAEVVLLFGLVLLGLTVLGLIIMLFAESNQDAKHNPVPDYNYDINEHQNYWEADSR